MTLDSQLYAQARELGLNVSRIAEEALQTTVAKARAERFAAEVRTDADALARYEAEHGSFAELARAHYAETGAPGAAFSDRHPDPDPDPDPGRGA